MKYLLFLLLPFTLKAQDDPIKRDLKKQYIEAGIAFDQWQVRYEQGIEMMKKPNPSREYIKVVARKISYAQERIEWYARTMSKIESKLNNLQDVKKRKVQSRRHP